MNRIVCIDDCDSDVMQKTNLIRIKPYSNPRDRTDKSLEDLIPLLVEIAKSNQMDVPKVPPSAARPIPCAASCSRWCS